MAKPRCPCCGAKLHDSPLPEALRQGWTGVLARMQSEGFVNPNYPGYMGSVGIPSIMAYARQHLAPEEYVALHAFLEPWHYRRRTGP